MDSIWQLSSEEIRVLGVLLEKQMTTPEYYPMTPNALKNACNQKSNRSPLVSYDDGIILNTLDKLRARQLVYVVSGAGSRTRKYEHRLRETLHLTKKEQAILCVLMLRGFQTIGELRGRTDRMVEFNGLIEVEETLNDLMAPGRKPVVLVTRLERQPGQKDHRYAHLLAGEITPEQLEHPAAAFTNATEASTADSHGLVERVQSLEEQLGDLRREFDAFRKQFE